jgi:competence protein ComEC
LWEKNPSGNPYLEIDTKEKKMRRNTFLQILLVLMLLALISSPAAASVPNSPAIYKLNFINVGQGDAALLIDPSGFAVLIDGGKTSAGSVLTTFIRSQGIEDIDVMVATHPDSDHIGGLIAVLEMADVPVKSVLYNGYPGTTQTWLDFVSAVQAEGLTLTTITYPQTFTWGTIDAQTLNPVAGLSSPDTNDACLAFLVQTGTIKTVLACDLDSSQENIVLARPVVLDADLLKVAHHGSSSSSSQAFLDAVTPKEAIISVGDNSYGHPDPATIARLEDVGARVWRTDQDGNIIVQTDGTIYAVNQNLPVIGITLDVYLPLIMRPDPPTPVPTETTPVPTETTPIPTETTPIPTETTPTEPTPVPTTVTPTPPPSVKVIIGTIFYDGVVSRYEPDEYVEIINQGDAVQLQGWTLRDDANHVYTFPSFLIQPNQACRIYTNQSHPESCGFNYGSGAAIWNNTGDCAYLRNSQGQEVSKKCYP